MANREEELEYQKYLAEQDANKFYAISENMGKDRKSTRLNSSHRL